MFIPVFIFLYCFAIFPRLYFAVDSEEKGGNAKVVCHSLGSEKLCNTTMALQVLANLLVWISYVAFDSILHPEAFHLLLARVRISRNLRASYETDLEDSRKHPVINEHPVSGAEWQKQPIDMADILRRGGGYIAF